MANRPRNRKIYSFNETVNGVYGQFKSNSSYPISFIQSSINIKRIDLLNTASDVFSSKQSDFSQLVQRDIDQLRVKDIANRYLKEGKDRVIFFPPLIVACMAVDDGVISEVYEDKLSVVDKENYEVNTTWGGDRFRLVLPYDDEPIGYPITIDDEVFQTIPYWSKFEINTNKVKLVVIDGQHRLSAIKYVAQKEKSAEESRKVLSDLEIPICILFPPDATQDNEQHETIVKDMRELFVRINSTAKTVSGHFITLLNDKSLSSKVVRAFCEKAKEVPLNDDFSLLNLIEWNERSDRNSSKINRAYSITTIRIVSDSLIDHAFCESTNNRPNITTTLLGLDKYKEDLDGDEVGFDELSEARASNFQLDFISEKMDDGSIKIAEALNQLFTSPIPYAQMISAFSVASDELEKSIDFDTVGASAYKNEVIGKYREVINDPKKDYKIDADVVVDRSKEFMECVKTNFNSSLDIYRANVFQQGYLRVWFVLSDRLYVHGLTQLQVAKALAKPLNLLCFNPDKRLFDNERVYLQKTLFNGAKIKVSVTSKKAWFKLIMSTFMNNDVFASFEKEIDALSLDSEQRRAVLETVKKISRKSYEDYISMLDEDIRKDFVKYWRDKELDKNTLRKLEEFHNTLKSDKSNEEAKEGFDTIIKTLKNEKINEARIKLNAVLDIS